MFATFAVTDNSSDNIETGYVLDEQVFRVPFPPGLGIFLSDTVSRLTLESTHLPIQWFSEALSVGVKRPRCENDH
jgi:hypothetical protein